MRLRVILIVKFDEEGTLAEIGGYAFELEGLESCPTEECGMCRGEITEILGEVFVSIGRESLLFCAGHLSSHVLADSTMGWPMYLLAVW